jgi:hypothetical protein
VITQVLVADSIKLIRGNPWRYVAAYFSEGVGCDPPGDTHQCDRLNRLNF